MGEGRRTQAGRSAETSDALIAAARPMFASPGYSEVSLENIVKAAGVTRGALYHHFADKRELFAAVFEQVEGEVALRMAEHVASTGHTDPVELMRAGAAFWLDACAEPEISRIVLVDAPAILGWTRWSEIGNRYNIGLVRTLLTDAIESGRIAPQPVEASAHVLLGAMREACLYLVRAGDRDQARQDAGSVIDGMIRGLTVG